MQNTTTIATILILLLNNQLLIKLKHNSHQLLILWEVELKHLNFRLKLQLNKNKKNY